jgi:ribose 5-phosphate isomerase
MLYSALIGQDAKPGGRNPMPPVFHVCPDPVTVAESAAEHLALLARQAVRRHGRFTVALSGGSTPRLLYERLARPPYRDELPWHRVHVFWSDERHVPAESPESNYHLVAQALLAHVPIRPEQIHRVPTELPPDAAAAAYGERLLSVLGPDGLDLVLLGVGEDGHTASLFPGSAALGAGGRGAAAEVVPQVGSWRVTLTLAEINRAQTVLFVATGHTKAPVVAAAGSGKSDLPAARVSPLSGRLQWWLDAGAAEWLPVVGGPGRACDGVAAEPGATGADVLAQKRAAGEAAAAGVGDGMTIGLGTGSTVRYTMEAIGQRLATGELVEIAAVPTSLDTAELASRCAIPLVTLEQVPDLDVTVDGADEVSPELDLIKGMGGALLREKIVASASRRLVVVADSGKLVTRLGTRSPLPIAVAPFGWSRLLAPLADMALSPRLRRQPDGNPVTTDDGLHVIDCSFAHGVADAAGLDSELRRLPGVVTTGFFLGMASTAYLAGDQAVYALHGTRR